MSKHDSTGNGRKHDFVTARGRFNEFPMLDDMCLLGSVSSTDCTGLIPTGAVYNADEYQESNELHKYGAPNDPDPKRA